MHYARVIVGFAAVLLCATTLAQDVPHVLQNASRVMGAGDLRSVRYAGDGIGYTFGQAYTPGMAWPKINIHSMVRTINFDTGSMRDEILLSRGEPRGGGGYPLAAQQRNDQFLSGAYAWNQSGPVSVAGPRFVIDRTHQLWLSPHGVIKAAIKNKASVQWQTKDGKSLAAVSFTEPGRFTATAYINEDYLVERIESRAPDAVLGEIPVVTTFSGYRDFGGVKFPTKIQQSQGGFPVLDVAIKEVEPNAKADIQLPDAVRTATEKVTTEKVADGVWFVAGGSHNSVAIEMSDHLLLVEAPLNDGRSLPVIEQVKQLAPGKPIRYVINSHNHFDHSGGLRAAAAEGATIITHPANKAYYERAFGVQSRINPDQLAKSGKKAKFRTVDTSKLALNDGTRAVEIHRMTNSVHTGTFLMVYLPKEKLLIQADAYTPSPPNSPVPAQPNANNVNLIENIERLNLAVDRILPLHGRVVPVAELYTTAGATPRK